MNSTNKNIFTEPNCDIVVGLVYGDEGKGKITNYLAKQESTKDNINEKLCIRYNGGPNAGHTVYKNDNKIITHQVPTGTIWGMKGLIGDNCYIDIGKLEEELKMIEVVTGDKTIRERLYISDKAHIIQQKHVIEDSKDETIGTTGSGIGPCAREKYERKGMQIGKNKELLNNIISLNNIIKSYDIIYSTILKNEYILVEGAQGLGLDISHGDYPYVTSSHCCATDCLNLGIPLKYVRDIYGVCKAYDTYVGCKEFQNPNDEVLKQLQINGEEFGATTGRQRQCNYLNVDFLIESIIKNSCTKVIINKCDILEKTEGALKLIVNDQIINYGNDNYNWKTTLLKIIANYSGINDIKLSYSKHDI
jgi:adenylosuccinate synthase